MIDDFEARLRSHLARDRDVFVPTPGIERRIRRVTRQRARRRRVAFATAATMTGLLFGVPTAAALDGVLAPGPKAAQVTSVAPGAALSADAGGPAVTPASDPANPEPGQAYVGADSSTASRRTAEPGIEAKAEDDAATDASSASGSRAPQGSATGSPDETPRRAPADASATGPPPGDPQGSDPAADATGTASADTGEPGVDAAAIADGAAAVQPAVECTFVGPDAILVDELGAWTATHSSVLAGEVAPAAMTDTRSQSWSTPGSYEVVFTVLNGPSGETVNCPKVVIVASPAPTVTEGPPSVNLG